MQDGKKLKMSLFSRKTGRNESGDKVDRQQRNVC